VTLELSLRSFLTCLALGACIYWTVDIALHLAVPDPGPIILPLTLLPPLAALAGYRYFGGRNSFDAFSAIAPLSMLLGIWALGPPAMAIGTVRTGGAFFTDVSAFLMVWAAFPLSTFVMSTYSGSLGGLIIVTMVLVVLACTPGARRVLMSIRVGTRLNRS
jgi:hypothetical protein